MTRYSSSLATSDSLTRPTPEEWRDQLDIIRRSIETRSGLRPGRSEGRWAPPAQVLFAVNLEHSLRTGDLIIDFLQRQRNKSGDLGRLKP
ncbi:MAG: hypothetical protein K8J08_22140, partial [Thermoanaerobaculia bacterium]|nr:hypothetical protein [Thermoanaerobaculia bacterium]